MAYKKLSGIYIIKNLINKKVYIGQSNKIKKRFNEHKRELKSNIHGNSYLQRAWNKYGENNFSFEILEKCREEDLNELEIFWIKEYKSLDRKFGYNLESGGNRNKKISDETKLKISIANKNCSQEKRDKISKANKNSRHGEALGNYTIDEIKSICTLLQNGYSPSKISKLYGYNRNTVSDIKLRKVWNYISSEYNFKNIDSYCDIKRKVVMMDTKLNIIKEFDSISIASEISETCSTSIWKCCINNQKLANGYVWMYYEDVCDDKLKEKKIYLNQEKTGITNNKKIMLIDEFGNGIKEFFSILEASKELNIDASSISKVCRGNQKTVKGYRFQYK